MIETDAEGNSCLHLAALQGSLDILSYLLQAGADVAAKNKNGKGAFDHTNEIKDEEKRALHGPGEQSQTRGGKSIGVYGSTSTSKDAASSHPNARSRSSPPPSFTQFPLPRVH